MKQVDDVIDLKVSTSEFYVQRLQVKELGRQMEGGMKL